MLNFVGAILIKPSCMEGETYNVLIIFVYGIKALALCPPRRVSTLFLEMGSSGAYYLPLLSKNSHNVCSFKSNKCAWYTFIRDKLLEFLLTSMSRPDLATKYSEMIVGRFSAGDDLKRGNVVHSCRGDVATGICIEAC
jgi:hypothetical protein